MEEGHSIQIDAPQRWSDKSQPMSPEDAVTRELEKRFGGASHVTEASSHSAGIDKLADQERALVMTAENEVLEPHTLPPGTKPHMSNSAMQDFCGSATANWGPFVSGYFSPCFVHTFLFGAVDVAFIFLALVRLRDLLTLPTPPARALTRGQLVKTTLSSLVAVYNLVMFAVHLAFDYGQPYQWLMYPCQCLTWSLCTALLLVEAKYGAPTNWVCKSFWIGSFVAACFLLWTNVSDPVISKSPDLAAFIIHYVLYACMAGVAVFFKEDSQDYSQLALDFSEISFDEDKTEASEDTRRPAQQPQGRGKGGKSGAGGGRESRLPLKRIVMLFTEERWLVAASLACCFIGAPIEVVQFIYVGMIVDDCAIPDGPNTLPEYTVVLVALYLIEAVSTSSQLIVTMMVGERMAMRLRRSVYQCVLRQEVAFVEGHQCTPQDVAGVLEQDVQRVQEAATIQLCMFLQSMIQVLVGSVFLLVLSWKLTLVGLAVLPVIALMMLTQSTIIQSYSKRSVEALERVEACASEVLAGVMTVRSFGKEGKERNRFGAELLQAYNLAKSMGVANGIAEGAGVLVLKICLVTGLFYGGSLVHNNELSGGILVSYVFIALQVIMSLSVLPPLVGDMANSVNSAGRIFQMLDRHPGINHRGGLTLPSIEGRIELRDVSFRYPSSQDQRALDSVNLVVEPGAHVAICGPARCGKTTVLAVIDRFFDPQEGLVLLDDTDITTFDPQWLRQHIGFVLQQPMLFTSSIAANIAFGQTATQQQIEEAAEAASVHVAILSLPEGYNTIIGTHPDTLNRAFRQKLCIARVVLKNPRILLLDEPTSSLDAAEKAEIEGILSRITPGRTVVSVSHRAEVLQSTSAIVVMKRGQVVEAGAYSDLMRKRGLFFAMQVERGAQQGGGMQFASDDRDEEEELSGGGRVPKAAMPVLRTPHRAGMHSRALELVEDMEHELEMCMPAGSGDGALKAMLDDISSFKRALAAPTPY